MDTPLDPFAGDPDDPARALEALDDTDEVRTPLLPAEREGVPGDLEDLEVFEALLATRGPGSGGGLLPGEAVHLRAVLGGLSG